MPLSRKIAITLMNRPRIALANIPFAAGSGRRLFRAGPGSYRPATFVDPANTFHEKAVLCRAAENSCFVATVNYASEGSPTTSAVAGPERRVISYQPYGLEGLLLVDVDLADATRLLASRFKPAAF